MSQGPRKARDRAAQARESAVTRATAARDGAVERAGHARDAAVERAGVARDAAVGMAGTARDAAVERAAAVKDSAAESIKAIKPKFRGVSHEWAFFLSLGLGISLLIIADTPKKLLAVGIYSVSLCALFGVSALYHRINWKSMRSRMMMRRLDHSMIFLLIAGTVTPFALLNLTGTWSTAILIAVWSAAIVGIIVELLWISSPKWVSAAMYVAVGWIGAVAFPQIVGTAGVWAGLLIATGGILYTVGAVVYATGRPDPSPAYFGYHEVFHLFVIGAAAFHFAAVAMFAL
ncbi:MAG: hemolysin III family protein [Solirubrobacterales bacterium]|nr:hemolysin III family protein [Solirubrobacterales bacterium]